MAPKLLAPAEVEHEMTMLNDWKRNEAQIEKVVTTADFVHAMAFVTSVALLAQAQDHHPDIDIRWNRVKLVLSTHSAGGLTANDFTLAKAIDKL